MRLLRGEEMARYKEYDYNQSKLIPVYFKDQILPGTFEYALNHIIDNELDLSIFLDRYKNDQTGAPAFDPAILLKIILFAYSHGITSSRKIEACCQNNILFKALAADTQPHFTTLADFISTMEKEITPLFRNVLLICDEMGLIGKEMFAIDGCKLSSNASKEWSGTREDFTKKKEKIEQSIEYILKKHRTEDKTASDRSDNDKTEKQLLNLRKKSEKIKRWLLENEDKPGKSGNIKKSNITDNESAKMASSHGVIQGYNGVAAADAKHQVIVHGEAHGEGSEHDLLKPMIEGAAENFKAIGEEDPIFKETKLLADSGFHTDTLGKGASTRANMKMLDEEKIDGYVADNRFRKRDPRFATAERHKNPIKKERPKKKYFTPSDFKYDETRGKVICPAGNALYLKNSNFVVRDLKGISYMARETDTIEKVSSTSCRGCPLRAQCLRKPNTVARQVTFFTGKTKEAKESFTQKMIKKIDSETGRLIYSCRMGIVEPVFANIRSTLGLDRFSLRGKIKVNTQWLLFCITHNLGKIHRYGLQVG